MRFASRQRTARALVAAFLVLGGLAAAPGCSSDTLHIGKQPEGNRRNLRPLGSKPTPSGSAEARAQSGEVAAGSTLVGVVGTHLYHRSNCGLLDGVPGKNRVPFVNAYDGLDSGYFPCDDCTPGP